MLAGVLYAINGTAVVVDSQFRNNQATTNGGCFALIAHSMLTVRGSNMSGNTAPSGGVLASDDLGQVRTLGVYLAGTVPVGSMSYIGMPMPAGQASCTASYPVWSTQAANGCTGSAIWHVHYHQDTHTRYIGRTMQHSGSVAQLCCSACQHAPQGRQPWLTRAALW